MKYKTLLPSYLDGQNITKHANIIDNEDNKIFQKMMLLSYMFKHIRPILIEKIQKTQQTSNIKVHINTTETIQSIQISGDYEETLTFTEDEYITEYTIEFTVNDESIIVNPDITVTVNTFEETTYTKGYPENDITQENIYDHDEFLDILGNLLNLPRRIYKPYPITDAANSTPPYMGKQITEQIVQECTEDDYYYSQRIEQFLQGNLKDYIQAATSSNIQLYNPIRDETLPGLDEDKAYLVKIGAYSNLSDDDYIQVIKRFIPITRSINLLLQEAPSIEWYTTNYMNYIHVGGTVTWNNVPLQGATLHLTEDEKELLTLKTDMIGAFEGVYGGFAPQKVARPLPLTLALDTEHVEFLPWTDTDTENLREYLSLDPHAWTSSGNTLSLVSNELVSTSGTHRTPIFELNNYQLSDEWALNFYVTRTSTDASVGLGQFDDDKAFSYIRHRFIDYETLPATPEETEVTFLCKNNTVYPFIHGDWTGQTLNIQLFQSGPVYFYIRGGVKIHHILVTDRPDSAAPTTPTLTPLEKSSSRVYFYDIDGSTRYVNITGKLVLGDTSDYTGERVRILINNKEYTINVGSTGYFSYTYNPDKPGENTIQAYYDGNNAYAASQTTQTTFIVTKIKPKLWFYKTYTDTKPIRIHGKLTNKNNQPIPNQEITLQVNTLFYNTEHTTAQEYTVISNNEGYWAKNYTLEDEDILQNITAIYQGNEEYTQIKTTTNPLQFTPNQEQSTSINTRTTLTNNTTNIIIGETITLTVTVKDTDENPVTKGYLTIYNNNTKTSNTYPVTSAETIIQYTPQTAGTNNIHVEYEDVEQEYSTSKSNTTTVTVQKHEVNIEMEDITATIGETIDIEVELTDENSDPVTEGEIEITLEKITEE